MNVRQRAIADRLHGLHAPLRVPRCAGGAAGPGLSTSEKGCRCGTESGYVHDSDTDKVDVAGHTGECL